ncbi:metal ABC transporter solute-binding protein, Zn/Mn family [Brevibacillus sp. TJ4]|uniref:metal ABC transporter solute-binding protein, Zn/Mn family n=1 Tax=Brevibacillus sp. TJ4 TaxID=3234853 RepID=UPI0037CF4ED4
MRKTKQAILSWVAAVALAGCGTTSTPSTPSAPAPQEGGAAAEKLTVYTTIYPLEYVTKRIGHDLIEVVNIVPPGVEPHDFEPTAKDMVAVTGADMFIYNGSGLELWVDKAVANLDTNHTQVVNTTEGIELIHVGGDEEGHAHEHADEHDHDHEHADEHADEHAHAHADAHDEHADDHAHEDEHEHADEHAHEDGHGHGHDHDHGDTDPHVWLDPTLLKAQAETIKGALVAKDPANASAYEANYQQLADDLDQLDRDFQEMAAQAAKKEFMVSHSAFSYLAKRYNLEQVAISGLNPAAEPSPSQMKQLVEYVKENQISYVLFETLVSPKVAEVIAREAGVKTATLNPLEGLTAEDVQAGKDYLSIMRENLETLRKALNE